ncbi:MAG: SusC/RagA family TonB-linked outer membrane protein, partial [Candidatus Cryptobacteroides sp.]
DESTSAIAEVNMEYVSRYPDLNVTNALQGQAAGLVVRSNSGALGIGSSLNIRGPHAFNSNNAIVVIDGIESSLEYLMPEQIESIEILKDAPAKVLYGPAAANGVIYVTTKRGRISEPVIAVSAEYGVAPSKFTADYLGSLQYAELYNEARANDGLSPYYQPWQIEGYAGSTGANDMLFPDVDLRKEVLRNSSTYFNANFSFNGGNRYVRYALTGGYKSGNGLEKVGQRSGYDILDLRANIDIPILDFITVRADAAADVKLVNRGVLNADEIFSAISSHRPNEYPLTIDGESLDIESNADGTPLFGGSEDYPDNLYADMKYGGKFSQRYITSNVNLSVDFNLNKYVKGLKVYGQVSMENYNFLAKRLKNTYPTYSIRSYTGEDGSLQQEYVQVRKLDLPKSNSITNSQLSRTMLYMGNVTWDRTFGRHGVSAVLSGRYMMKENKGLAYDRSQAVYALRLNYNWAKRYLAEVVLSNMGTNKFAKGNRYFFSPAASLGWVISEENFLRNSSWVDFLKIKASAGLQGYGVNTDFDLFRSSWKQGDVIKFGENNSTTRYLVPLVRLGNPDLKWESVLEFNAGLEWRLFDERLYGEFNFFSEEHRDIIGSDGVIRTDELGDYTIATNLGSTSKKGVDLMIGWNEDRGAFKYDVGMTFLFTKDKIISADELPGIEEYRSKIGKSAASMFGLKALGLFGKDVAIEDSPRQTFGSYQEGDIAYMDMNGDNVIDTKDLMKVGSSFPTGVWSIHADLNWKGWGLYVLATAETGAGFWKTNPYWWNYGEGKYSVLAADRYHPVNNPNGTYPRLTTMSEQNNFRNSTFWYQSSDFLRLKNLELSYTFQMNKKKTYMSSIRLFLRGTNLAVWTPVKDVDPECPSGGVTTYPYYATYTGGFKVTF